MSKQSLSILSNIKIKEPCHEAWRSMTGNERQRHCDKCAKCVTNLSAMKKSNAERFLERNRSKNVCVRYSIDSKGDIKFRVGWMHSFVLAITAVITFFGLSSNSFAQSSEASELKSPMNENLEVTGGIAVPLLTPTPVPTSDTTDRIEKVIMGEFVEPGK